MLEEKELFQEILESSKSRSISFDTAGYTINLDSDDVNNNPAFVSDTKDYSAEIVDLFEGIPSIFEKGSPKEKQPIFMKIDAKRRWDPSEEPEDFFYDVPQMFSRNYTKTSPPVFGPDAATLSNIEAAVTCIQSATANRADMSSPREEFFSPILEDPSRTIMNSPRVRRQEAGRKENNDFFNDIANGESRLTKQNVENMFQSVQGYDLGQRKKTKKSTTGVNINLFNFDVIPRSQFDHIQETKDAINNFDDANQDLQDYNNDKVEAKNELLISDVDLDLEYETDWRPSGGAAFEEYDVLPERQNNWEVEPDNNWDESGWVREKISEDSYGIGNDTWRHDLSPEPVRDVSRPAPENLFSDIEYESVKRAGTFEKINVTQDPENVPNADEVEVKEAGEISEREATPMRKLEYPFCGCC